MKPHFWTISSVILCGAVVFLQSRLSAEENLRDGIRTPWTSGVYRMTSGGRNRAFILDLPQTVRTGAPLVMVFHGFTGSAKAVRELTGFVPLVEKHGFVAVYPEGTTDSKGKSFFNVGYEFHRDQTVDDVGFARELVGRLVRDLGVDPKAVFATGFSNGADMSFYLGAQPKPFVCAIAPVAGTMMESWAKGFRPADRISVLAVNARRDRTTLWDGDLRNRDGWGAYLGTEGVVDLWVKGLALTRQDQVVLSPGIQRTRWFSGVGNTEVKLYALEVGGHEWPRHLGEENRTTAEVIWSFFDDHRPRSR